MEEIFNPQQKGFTSKSLKSKQQHLNSISSPSGSTKYPFSEKTDEKGKLLNKLIEKVRLSSVVFAEGKKSSEGIKYNFKNW